MKYIKLVIAVDDKYQESLIAELMDLEFDEFQQTNDELITYIPKERFHIGDRERIEHLLSSYPGEGYLKSEEIVEEQNWNQEWEKTIQAQSIGRFFVRPTWSDETPSDDQILLQIDPKMSFGTGYHETTRLMLRELPTAIQPGDSVLDAGTGTAILAIAAVKLGAAHVLAFDIDDWSITNARENLYLNEVSDRIQVVKGTHTDITDKANYDVILANIQQNIISEMIPFFAENLKEGGFVLLSGLLEKDEDKIRNLLENNHLKYLNTTQENEWIAIKAEK